MSSDDSEQHPNPARSKVHSWGRNRPSGPSQDTGRVIAGKYRLSEVLGEGGMGRVWLARNITLDVDVAIKILHPGKTGEQAESRLLQEARVAAQLKHPSIVRIYDFGRTESGTPFIVMEVLDGELLSDVLVRKGRLSAINAVSTLLPVVDAVATAHDKDVVHRDLKPENVLLVSDSKGSIIPKVLDFGIAKLKAEQSDVRRATRQRLLIGTPAYMSPEQCSWTENIDARSDVWALSVILYELCAGNLPFHGVDAHAILLAVANDEPKPLTDLAAGDEELWRIVARGLEKDREFRWANARELGLALADWATRNGLGTDIAGNSIEAHWFSGGQRRPLSLFPPAPGGAPETPRGMLRTRRDSDSQPHSMESGERPKPNIPKRRRVALATLGLVAVLLAAFAVAVFTVSGISPLPWARALISNGKAKGAPSVPASPTPEPSATAAAAVFDPGIAAEPTMSAESAPATSAPVTKPATPAPVVTKKKPALPRQRTEW